MVENNREEIFMNTKNDFFDWTSLQNCNDFDMVIHSVFSSGFCMDVETGIMCFTRKAAFAIAPFNHEPFKNISAKDFTYYLTVQTGEAFFKRSRSNKA